MSLPKALKLTEIQKVPNAGLREMFALLIKSRLRFKIKGHSMLPLLNDGSDVLVKPVDRVYEGDLIVSRHPYKTDVILVKYVAEIRADGALYVLGTSLQNSTDSRHFGYLPFHLVYGKVMSKFNSSIDME